MPTSNGAARATGVPKPAAPLHEQAEEPGDQHRLQPPVIREPCQRPADSVDRAGRPLELVERERAAG